MEDSVGRCGMGDSVTWRTVWVGVAWGQCGWVWHGNSVGGCDISYGAIALNWLFVRMVVYYSYCPFEL